MHVALARGSHFNIESEGLRMIECIRQKIFQTGNGLAVMMGIIVFINDTIDIPLHRAYMPALPLLIFDKC